MRGARAAGALLLIGSLVGCGAAGPSPEEIAAAAERFGQDGDLHERGRWIGSSEPPRIFERAITVHAGTPLSAIDRSSEFPKQLDLLPELNRWKQRGSLDLNLVVETVVGPVRWTALSTEGGTLVRSAPSLDPDTGAPVGNWSDPSAPRAETRLATPIAANAQLVADRDLAVVLEPGVSVTFVRAAADGALTATTHPLAATRVCATADVLGTAALAASADPSGSSCEQLWLEREGSLVDGFANLEGDVVGVGFSDGLAFVVAHAGCVASPCPLVARLHGPDGAIVRELGELGLPDRDRAIVGNVDGVPVVFGGDGRSDGVAYAAAEHAWLPIRRYPLAQEGLTEAMRVSITEGHLVVATRNAIGLWSPAGDGRSWQKPDLYRYELWVATEDSCLNLRTEPSVNASVIRCVDRGVRFLSDGSHATSGEIEWISVLLPELGLRGWVAEEYLSGVSPYEPDEFYCGAP